MLSSPVEVECEAVDAQGVGEQVEGLAQMADAVCSSEPEGVVKVAVDAFGVVATGVETVEVRVVGWDRSQVLGAVELALLVVGVAVQSDGDDTTTVLGRESVVVIPAVGPGFGSGAVGAGRCRSLCRETVVLAALHSRAESACRLEY